MSSKIIWDPLPSLDEKTKALADLGQQLVDLAESGATWECPFCAGIISGPHSNNWGEEPGAKCPLDAVVRMLKKGKVT